MPLLKREDDGRIAILPGLETVPRAVDSVTQMTVELHISKKGESTCLAVLGEFEIEGLEELQARLEYREQSHTRPVLDLKRILVVEPEAVKRSMAVGSSPAGHADPDG